MKKIFYYLMDVMGNKKIILIVSVIILVHLGWTLFSFNYKYQKETQKVLESRVHLILSNLNLMRSFPENERKAVLLKASPDSIFFKIYLLNFPKFKNRFYLDDKRKLGDFLKNKKKLSNISLQIDKENWINFHFEPPLHEKWMEMTFISVGEFFLVLTVIVCFLTNYQFKILLFRFKNATERLGVDLKSTPISIDGPVSIQEAAKSVNQMQQRIQNLITGRTRMLAAISHDLKTPLTRMVLRTELLPDANLQQSFSADLDEMKNMIKETLAYAKEDSNTGKKTFLDLVSLLEVVCYENQEMGEDVYFESKLKKAPFIGNVLSLRRAFGNIIDNALRYGKKAIVTLYSEGNFLVVDIQDAGPGIEESEKENLFLPFHRGVAEKSFSGTGLGLTIAHEIIQSHGGKISLENLPDSGLLVKIVFPLSMISQTRG